MFNNAGADKTLTHDTEEHRQSFTLNHRHGVRDERPRGNDLLGEGWSYQLLSLFSEPLS